MEDPKTLLLNYEAYALGNPSARKILPDREMYVSDNDVGGWMKREALIPVISDFGNAVRGEQSVRSGFIQPDTFCAPQISFGMSWSYSVGHVEFCVCTCMHAFLFSRMRLLGVLCIWSYKHL